MASYLLNSHKYPKGIYVIGEKCTGKSKFIQKFLKNHKDIMLNAESDQTFCRKSDQII